MKISEYKQMMAYLTRPKSKGGEVKVRKPNAVPPKTKTIQKFSKGGAAEKPYGKVLFNQGTGKFEGLTPEDDLLFEGIEYDAVLGKFVDSKTGKTGSLSDFTEVIKKKGTFEQIVDRLKAKVKDGRAKQIKKVSKKPTQLELPLDKPEEPKPNVIPLNPKPDSPFGTPGGWMSEAADVELKKDTRKDETLAEYMARKETEYQKKLMEEALSNGIGTLL